MQTLFDSLQKKLGDNTLTPLAPQQAGVAAALRAKSGKAGASTSPAASNLGEAGAVANANAQAGQVQQAGQIQAANIGQQAQAQDAKVDAAQQDMASQRRIAQQGLATQGQVASETRAANEGMALDKVDFDEGQRTELLNVKADQALRELASERGISIDNIFREFDRSEKELAFRKDAAQLEQTGFILAMRDKQYLDELNRVGAERDLQDKLNFQDEMNRIVLGDELDKLFDELNFKRGLNANQREWDSYIASLDVHSAISMANAAIQDDSRNQMISGVGNTAKAGVDAYYKYDMDQKQQQATNLQQREVQESNPGFVGPRATDASDPSVSNATPATVGNS